MSDQPNDHAPQDRPATPPQGQPQQGGYPQAPGAGGPPAPGGYPGGYAPGQAGYPAQGGYPQNAAFPPQPDYGQQGYGYPQPAAQPSALGGLADLGFTRRITPALAKVVYVVVLVLAVIFTIVGIIAAIGSFSQASDAYIGGGGFVFSGLLFLVTSPLISFVMVAFARFWLEYFLDRAAARTS